MKNIALTFYPRCFIIARRTYKTFYFDKYFMSINNEITTRGFKFCKGRPFHLKGYQLQSHLWHSESLLLSIFHNFQKLSVGAAGLVWLKGRKGPRLPPAWRRRGKLEEGWNHWGLLEAEIEEFRRAGASEEQRQIWVSPVLTPADVLSWLAGSETKSWLESLWASAGQRTRLSQL